jgi:hypothetical protein
MSSPKAAFSGVFIGENAHKSQGLRYTYRENALAQSSSCSESSETDRETSKSPDAEGLAHASLLHASHGLMCCCKSCSITATFTDNLHAARRPSEYSALTARPALCPGRQRPLVRFCPERFYRNAYKAGGNILKRFGAQGSLYAAPVSIDTNSGEFPVFTMAPSASPDRAESVGLYRLPPLRTEN